MPLAVSPYERNRFAGSNSALRSQYLAMALQVFFRPALPRTRPRRPG